MTSTAHALTPFSSSSSRASDPSVSGLPVHEQIATIARLTPDSIAIRSGTGSLSYAQLEALANGVAARLLASGVEKGARVGLCTERTAGMAVGVLGILKAGCAWVPFDPTYPRERLAFMLQDSRIAALVGERQPAASLTVATGRTVWLDEVDGEVQAVELPRVSADDVAYVIYTSGSTGAPKGVQITHGNLLNYLPALREPFAIGAEDRYLHTASIAFSSSVRQLLVPLSAGASVVVASPDEIRDPRALFETIQREQVTVVDLVPSFQHTAMRVLETLDEAVRQRLLDNRLRLVLSASEPLPTDVPLRWRELLGEQVRLINMFGQTETTGIVSSHEIDVESIRSSSIVPIGRAIEGVQLHVLDDTLQPVAEGEVGELCVGGAAVGAGYFDRATLTAERFIADPFVPGGRLYRTGDRVRRRTDGALDFLGRADNQVKLRGFRVEIEEVEALLRQQSGVRECAVMAWADASGDQRLVAYVVPTGRPAPTPSALRSALARALPDYMVPASFVALDRLPRTPNGKVSRGDLPAPDQAPGLVERVIVPATTPTQQRLVEIWRAVLDVAEVGIQDDFFEIGGHSLKASQVVARIRQELRCDLPLRAIFESPTIAAIAATIDAGQSPATEQVALAPIARTADMPLSFAQERLWLLNQIEPDGAAYNLCAAIRLRGALDEAALERTLSEIVRRHEALRTVFPTSDGSPTQRILAPGPVELRRVELAERGTDAEAAVRTLAAEESRRPFDLESGPLFRAAVVRVAPEEHVLVVTMHHIVSDGWSRGVLYREITTLYEAFAQGRSSPLPEPTIQYADYADWQRRWLSEQVLEAQLGYWRERLAGPLPTLDLPTDRPRPAIQTSNGATFSFPLPQSLCDRLQAIAREENATLYMAFLSAFQTLLGRYSGQEDVIVGSPVAGRSTPEVEGLIGFFVNTLVMRGDLSGNPTFRSLLGRTREYSLGAFAHQDLPFDRLVDALHPTRDLSRSPLFQVLMILQNTPLRRLELSGLEVNHLDVDLGASKLDITLSLVAVDEGYVGHLEYNTDLFDAATIERLAGHFRTLLQSAAEQPDLPIGQLAMLTVPERTQLLESWNATERAYPDTQCVHELFEAQVRRTPDAIAVSFENQQLTYAELDARANQLANRLRTLGVGPDVLVGVCVERSIEMMVGLLGILKAGGAYVPLDPAYPRDRVALMLKDSQVQVVLTQRRLKRRLGITFADVICLDSDWESIARERTNAPATGATPSNLAYVIYTSGSTGRPKGVMVQHGNVANFFTGMDERIGSEQPGVWLAVTSISFDISVLELFWTLTRGYHVVIQGDERAAAKRAGALPASSRKIDFSLFYFASEDRAGDDDKYKLLFDGARFADQNGFAAVWTPERHFHAFGGLYPNAATTSAALAAMTKNVKLRAGSVVLPLHNPIRVAEEWAFVDNISRGRVGIAIASGWHDRDFVFAPDNYANRRELMYEQIETVRKLWRGERVTMRGGTGKEVEISTLPRPVQPELPIWVTAAGTRETFEKAGQIGANLLTHLLGQSVEQLNEKLAAYRAAYRAAGHAGDGHVTLMMHTFVGDDLDRVRAAVWSPFREYLRTSVDLIKGLAEGRGQDIRSASFSAEDMEALLDHAFERYFQTSALMGTPESCVEMVERLKGMGVDEIACLIDFGVDRDLTLSSLELLGELREECNAEPAGDPAEYGIARQLARHRVTHFQCTPSMASMLLADDEARAALGGVETMMVGGEALPGAVAEELRGLVAGRVVNMYGPTETTIWSSTQQVEETPATIPIGRPIANTEFYILDRNFQPTPVGVPGELCIGGAGVVRGYLRRPELTEERFIPHPFRAGGSRLYRTGDLARYRADGTVEFLGRLDHQVKVRGHRIELGEIESVMREQPGIREAVVVAREDSPGDKRLVGYVSLLEGSPADGESLRAALRARLPEYMVPSHVVVLEALPLTPNAKVDRKALPAPEQAVARTAVHASAESALEHAIAGVWRDVLRVADVSMHDNFFDVGGHSLLVVRVHSRLRALVDQPVTITDLFRFPTIRSLAQHLGSDTAPSVNQDAGSDRAEARKQAMLKRRQRRQ